MSLQHEIRNRHGVTETISLTPIRAIRHMCLECLSFSPKEVKCCTNVLCPLFPYRIVKNPERTGVGGRIKKNP